MLLRSQLDLLPPEIRSGVMSGRISAEEALSFLREEDAKFSGGMSPALSSQQQQFIQGYEEAGGADASTLRATGAAASTDLRSRGRGIQQLVEEGAFIQPPSIPGVQGSQQLIGMLPGVSEATQSARSLWQELTGANTPEAQAERELSNARLLGRQTSTAQARERAGEIGKIAIDLGPNVSQAGTTFAALIATRNPALAATIAGLSAADIGSSVVGNEYRRAREQGLSETEAMNFAKEKLVIELGTEALVPGGGKTASFLKAFGKATGAGAIQEGIAQFGGNVLEQAKYPTLAPDSVTEGVGRSILLGFVGSGIAAAPGAALDVAGTIAERSAIDAAVDKTYDSPLKQGADVGRRIIQQVTGKITPPGEVKKSKLGEQLPLFENEPDFVRRPEFEKPDRPDATLTPREDEFKLKEEQPIDIVRNRVDIPGKLEADKRKEAADLKQANEQQELQAEMFPDAGATKPTLFEQGKAQRAEAEADRLRAAKGALEQRYSTQTEMFPNEPPQVNPQERAQQDAAARNAELVRKQQEKEAKEKAKAAKEQDTLRQKARTLAEQQIAKEYPNATPQQFDTLAGLRAKRLLSAQPKATPKAVKQAPVSKGATATPKGQQQAAAAAPDVDTVLKQMEKDDVFSTLGTDSGKKKMTREALRKKLIYDDSKDAELLRQAIASGKLTIMKNQTQAGFDESVGVKGVHRRDTGEVYLFTDNISEESFNGILLHEVSHNLDRRLGDKKTVLNFAGEKANERYAREIEQLSASGNKVAMEAMKRYEFARKAVGDKQTGRDEIVKYFIEELETAKSGAKPLGRAANLAKDLVSSVRVGFSRATGMPINVKLSDLAYAVKTEGARQTTKPYVDQYSGRKINVNDPKAKIPDLEFSVIGPKAATWDKVSSPQFEGVVDEVPRKELNTRNAKIIPAGLSAASMRENVTAKEILDFPELYEAYPDLADIRIVFDDTSGESYYSSDDNMIKLGKRAAKTGEARKLMLHELQHAIQVKEGFDRGDNPDRYLTQDEKDEMDKAMSGMQFAANSMNQEQQEKIRELVGLPSDYSPYMTLRTAAQEFDDLSDEAKDVLNKSVLFRGFRRQYDKYMPLRQKSFDGYQRAGGEVEARLVEARADLTQGEREEMPFYDTLRTSRYASNQGKVTKSDITPSRNPRSPGARDNAEEFSVDTSQTSTPAFKKWFEDSKVVDENGNPKIVYHGTNANIIEFGKRMRGEATGAQSAKMGFFFASNPKVASSYTYTKTYDTVPLVSALNKITGGFYERFNEAVLSKAGLKSPMVTGGNVMPIYLSMQNPLIIDQKGKEYREETYASILKRAQEGNYDGVIIKNTYDDGFTDVNEPTDVYVVFEPNQIKSAISNRGTFSRNDNRIDFSVDVTYNQPNQFAETDPESIVDTKKAFKQLWKGRVPDDVIELMDRGRGEGNAYALRAMNHLNRINKEIAKTGNPEATVAALKAYENTKTRAERLAMADKLREEMPAVFAAFNTARRDIALMSREIVLALKGQGRALSEAEKALIQSVENNIGNYLTTTYKAFSARKVRAEHIKWINTTEEGKAIKDKVRNWARTVLFNIDDLNTPIDRGNGDVRRASISEVEAVYEALVPANIRNQILLEGGNRRKKMMEAIERAKPQISNELKDAEVERFVEDLLRLGQARRALGRAAQIYGGTSQNKTIVTAKTDVPKVIRDLWGEQDNPVMNVFATLVRQGEYVAKARTQLALLSELEGKYLFRDKPLSIDPKVPLVQITSDGMGPLAGLWTTEHVKTFLESKSDVERTLSEIWENTKINDRNLANALGETTNKVGRVLGRAGSKYKFFSVVLNPYNWAMNAGGAWTQMMINGNFNPKYVYRGIKGAGESIGAAFKQTSSESLMEYVRNGVLDSALAGEIQEAERQSIIAGLTSGNAGLPRVKLVEKLMASTSDAYAATDIWAKIANYEKEKEFITKLSEASGANWSDTEIERKAAERVRKTNFSYDRAFRPAKFFEKNGITNFLTYNTETIRTLVGNTEMAYRDIGGGIKMMKTNPVAARMLIGRGMERIAGVTAGAGFHYAVYSAIGAALSAALGAPEEDEKERAIKRGLAGYLQDDILTLVGVNGAKREYFDSGRLDPYGPATTIMRAVNTAIEQEDWQPLADAADGLFIVNELLKQGIKLAMGDPKSPRLAKAAEDFYAEAKSDLVSMGISPERADGAIRLAEAALPAFLRNSFSAMASAANDTEGKKSPERYLFEAFGGKFVEYDPEVELANTAKYQYGAALADGRNTWSNWFASVRNPTDSQIEDKFIDITNDEFEAWSKTRPAVEAALLAGVPRRVIQDKLSEDTTGVGRERVPGLINGRFFPSILTDEKLTADMSEAIQDAETREEASKQRQKYMKVRPVIRRLQRNYKGHEE